MNTAGRSRVTAAVCAAVLVGVVGCSPTSTTSTGAGPDTGSSSDTASATSSSAEATPTSSSPEVHETVLTSSTIYNRLSTAEQTKVGNDVKLSFEDLQKLDESERAEVALVLMDANSADYISEASKLVLPGNYGKPLGDNPSQIYGAFMADTANDLSPSNSYVPYNYVGFQRAIAFNIAKSGDPAQLEVAKKMISGSVSGVEDRQADRGNTQFLKDAISQLEQVSTNKSDPDETLHYPDGWVNAANFHTLPTWVALGLKSRDVLGNLAYAYDAQEVRVGSSTITAWVMSQAEVNADPTVSSFDK